MPRKRPEPPPPCPDVDKHTPSPEGYLAWHAWADEMGKTHHQVLCSGCQRWSIWVPNDTDEGTTDGE